MVASQRLGAIMGRRCRLAMALVVPVTMEALVEDLQGEVADQVVPATLGHQEE